MAVTPMMQQYLDIKAEYTDSILLFRVMTFRDVLTTTRSWFRQSLSLPLPERTAASRSALLCVAFPYHAADTYISRLVDKGYKVVVCDQVEDPALAKGLVKRKSRG